MQKKNTEGVTTRRNSDLGSTNDAKNYVTLWKTRFVKGLEEGEVQRWRSRAAGTWVSGATAYVGYTPTPNSMAHNTSGHQLCSQRIQLGLCLQESRPCVAPVRRELTRCTGNDKWRSSAIVRTKKTLC